MNMWGPVIMWIHVYPNWKTNFNCKNGRKRSFSYETKALINLSQRGEWIGGAQSLKEKRFLCESAFFPIQPCTLILQMVEREVFLMKPMHQFIYPKKENEFMVPNR